MQKEYLYGIIGLLAGILITIIFAQNAVNTNNVGMLRVMGMRMNNQLRCPMEETSETGESQGSGIKY